MIAGFGELGRPGDAELAQEAWRSLSGLAPPEMGCSCSVAANGVIGSWTERCNAVLKKASPVLPGLDVVGREDVFWSKEDVFWGMEYL